MGKPFSANIPSTAARPAAKIVHSNVMGMKEGQLWNGRPPTLTGSAMTAV